MQIFTWNDFIDFYIEQYVLSLYMSKNSHILDIKKYISANSILNGIEYVYSYDDKDLNSVSKRNAIKEEIMGRPEWNDAVEIFNIINKKNVFKKKYHNAFIFIIYCIIIGPDIKKVSTTKHMKGGAPNALVQFIARSPFNIMLITGIMMCLFSMYVIVEDINYQLESQNIYVDPVSNNEALDKLMDSPEYATYEKNLLDYYGLSEEDQDSVNLMEYKIKSLEKRMFPKKLNLFNAFTLGFALNDVGKGLLQYVNNKMEIQREFLEEITSEYLRDKTTIVVDNVLVTRQPNTLLEKLNYVINGNEELKRTIEDTGKNIKKQLKRSKNDFKHLLSNLEVEIEDNYNSALTRISRKIDDYHNLLSYPCYIMYTLILTYVATKISRAAASSMNTTTNNALLEDVKKPRGRPKGSKDTRPRITRKKTLMIEDKQQSGGNCTRKMH